MKTIISYNRLILAMIYFCCMAPYEMLAQINKKVLNVSAAELSTLRKSIEKRPENLEAHQTYIEAMGISNPQLEKQYEVWSDKYPATLAVPLAIGRKYFEKEMPQAKAFLLKAAKLKPEDAKIWFMLSIDAQRWGNNQLAQEYMGKASLADPKNVDYAYYHASLFSDTEPEVWKKMAWALVEKFKGEDRAAITLSNMGFLSEDLDEKISIFEKMRSLFPDTNFLKAVGMSRLAEAYIQRGDLAKAMELSAAMPVRPDFKRLKFRELHDLAQKLSDIESQLKTGRLTDAKQTLANIPMANGSVKGFDIGNYLVRLTATVLDTNGATQSAYDSLQVYMAKKPDEGVQTALKKYGQKIGKNERQVKADILASIYRNAKPSPDFNLGLYTSNGKLSLADLKGKVTLLTFWFPGCGPCRAEMPYFQRVMDKYKGKDVAYIGINVAPEQDDYVLSFMKGTGYTFTPLRANWKWAQENFGIRGAPSNFIIDKDGKIAYANFMVHADNTKMLELMIESLM